MSSSDPQVTELAGGTIRVSHGPSSSAPTGVNIETSWEPIRVHNGGSVSYNAGGEVEQRGQHTIYRAGQDDALPTSVMQSAKNVNGRTTVQLIPGVEGSRTDVRSAVREGLVREVSPGVWVDTAVVNMMAGQAPQPAPQWGQPEPEQAPLVDPGQGVFDPEDEKLWNEDIAPLSQSVYESSLARGIAAVVDGGSLENLTASLVRDAGLEPALAADYAQQGTAMYQRTVDRAMGRVGLEGDDLAAFYADLRKNPGQLRHALQTLVYSRDVSVFRSLAMDFQTARQRRGQ